MPFLRYASSAVPLVTHFRYNRVYFMITRPLGKCYPAVSKDHVQ